MAFSGVLFEDEFGLLADPFRIIYVPNSPSPTPMIPTTPLPPGQLIYLSMGVPYIQTVAYRSGITVTATITFGGYTIGAQYLFKCAGRTQTIAIPTIFPNRIISWYDNDGSVKGTPESNISDLSYSGRAPLLTGNDPRNPHIQGDNIVVLLTTGEEYTISNTTIARTNEYQHWKNEADDVMNSGAQCNFLDSDPDRFAKQR